jgi:hypothetical protein
MTVQKTIDLVTNNLVGIKGIAGTVLGGSRARGTHRPTSDIDIGVYYDAAAGFEPRDVGAVAARIDDQRREGLVTGLGEWGPWVNGGGWLIINGWHVDLIFRDIDRVARAIDAGRAGQVETHYHAGHPHAYLNVMYMGEVAICRILADPEKRIAALQAKTRPYPELLRKALTDYFLFEAAFSLRFAGDNADKDDISYVAGCCFRTIACLNQVLFAQNGEYCVNEKKAAAMVDGFSLRPQDYKRRIDTAIAFLGTELEKTRKGIEILRDLVAETEELLGR